MSAVEVEPFVVTEPGLYDGVPDAVYHGDPVPEGSLSSTGMKRLLPPSCPAIFAAMRGVEVHKDVFDFGKAAHRKVLGVGPDLVVIPGERWDTKAAKEALAEVREAGAVPLKQEAMDRVDGMAAALAAHPYAGALFAGGKPEQSAFWQRPNGTWLRARFDWLPNPVDGRRTLVPDYKSAASVEPDKWGKAAADFGYVVQQALYTEALVALGVDPDPAFLFVAQEKTAPYVVEVFEFTEQDQQLGRRLVDRAIEIYDRCTAADHWPTYAADVITVALPPYYVARTEEYLSS